MSDTAPPNETLHHGSRAHQLVLVTVIALVLPTIFVLLRLFARRVLRIRLYFDDWLIIVAYVRWWMRFDMRPLLIHELQVFKIGLDISGALRKSF